MSYWSAFALTLLVEAPVWAWGMPYVARASAAGSRGVDPQSVPSKGSSLAAGTVASAVTHPLLWFAAVPALRATIGGSVAPVLIAEALVCVVEGLVVARLIRASVEPALLVAVVANATSVAVGVALLW